MKSAAKNKISSIRRAVAVILLVCTISVSPIASHEAKAWDALMAAIEKQAMEEMSRLWNGIIRGLLKTVAATLINNMVSRLASGGSGGPKFITNWEDYIISSSGKKATSYANAYIDQAFSGRGSKVSYQSGSNFEGVSRGTYNPGYNPNASYSQIASDELKKTVTYGRIQKFDYTGALSKMYAGGTSKEMSQLAEPPNALWTQAAWAEELRMQKAENERDIALAKAMAGQGYLPTEKNGQTITPGIVTKDAVSNSQNIGNLIVATANDIPEVLTGLATKLITQAITNGIGNISARIQKEVNDQTTKALQARNAQPPSSMYRR